MELNDKVHPAYAALQARFAYQFAGPDIGISVAPGWLPVFETLCVDIDHCLGQDKQGFYWRQVKEKFGIMRCSFVLTRQESRQAVQTLISAAQLKTGRLCEVCGQPGTLDESSDWLRTVCQQHSEDHHG